ncbi:MAG: sulfite exporter TauE/SafE family protein [Pirellulaceae bacterium]
MLSVVGAAIIGLTLGLFGSGGSILTVPVLVYLLDRPSKIAVAESLAIVGMISLIVSVVQQLRGQIAWRYVVNFGLPAMPSAWLGAWLSQFVSDSGQLLTFAALVLSAAGLMFRINPEASADSPQAEQPVRTGMQPWVILQGVIVGIITGFVGVGGGFLIVPALTIFCKLPTRTAMGTSLVIIVLNSVVGLYKHLDNLREMNQNMDWQIVFLFAGVGLAGSFVGERINRWLDAKRLRQGFGVFLILIGLFVMVQEVPKLLGTTTESSLDNPIPIKTNLSQFRQLFS